MKTHPTGGLGTPAGEMSAGFGSSGVIIVQWLRDPQI